MKTFLVLCLIALPALAPAQNVGLSYAPDPGPFGSHPGQLNYSGSCWVSNSGAQKVSVVVNQIDRHSGQQTSDSVSYKGTYVLNPGEEAYLGDVAWYLLSDAVGEIGFDDFQIDSVAVVAGTPPAIVWTSAPGNAGSGQAYTVTAHGHDDDGNLTQVNVWKNGQPFAFGGGGNGTDADSGNSSSDGGPQTITFTAQAVDAAGAVSPVITQIIAIDPPVSPPPVQYSLSTSTSAGGSVSPGGWFNSGASATVSALPDSSHDFVGWSGDAGGAANPLDVLMDRNKAVQAVFALKSYPLTTSAINGGSVTPGGTYPYGTTVILSAVPDSTHRFIGWAGDAGGSLPSIALTMTAPKAVQAIFADKFAQSILFSPPGDLPVGAPPVGLDATSTSGLPVTYAVLSGPATLTSGNLQVTGPGTITLQATQTGDALYLPATPVTQTLNVFAAATIKYRASSRTLLQAGPTTGSAIYVLEKP